MLSFLIVNNLIVRKCTYFILKSKQLFVLDIKIHVLGRLLEPVDKLADWKKDDYAKVVGNIAEHRGEVLYYQSYQEACDECGKN